MIAVSNVSISVAEGEIVAVAGGNDAGKSTLLRARTGTRGAKPHSSSMKRGNTSCSVAGYLACQCALGCAVGLVCALLMLATDTAGIRTLITASGQPVSVTLIFLAGSVITFVPFVLATAIGLLSDDDEA